MKKLLGILILGLLWCNVSVAEIEKLPEGTTVNSLLKDGYKLFSTNVVAPSKNQLGALIYNLIKGKVLVTCLMNASGGEVKSKVVCLKP